MTDLVDALVDELFQKIETAQGYAHMSDSEHFATKQEFFDRIRGRREHAIRAVDVYTTFLRKHGELP